MTDGRAVRGDLLVGVAVVDGAGEGVQLLQGDAHLDSHVVGDQVPAGHAEEANKYFKRTNQKHQSYVVLALPQFITIIMQ